MSVECGDKDELPDGHTALRRVMDSAKDIHWDPDEGRWRINRPPTGNSLQVDEEDGGISVYWSEHLREVHTLEPSAVLAEGYPLVFAVNFGAARRHFDAVHDPQERWPIQCAHSLLRWSGDVRPGPSERKAIRSRLSDHMFLVHGDPTVERPPGA